MSDLLKNNRQEHPNCIVLTGAPCSGKTTTLRQLQKMGFGVCDEAAELYVVGELNKGKGIQDILADYFKLETEITRLALLREAGIADSPLHFLDRSAIDSIAYSRFYSVNQIPFEDIIRQKKYHKTVFLFERLGLLGDRLEHDDNEALHIEEKLETAYQELDYEIIRVPLMSVRQRAWFILSQLQKGLPDFSLNPEMLRRLGNVQSLQFTYKNVKAFRSPVPFDEQEDARMRSNAAKEGIGGIIVCSAVVNEFDHVLFLKRALHDDHAPGGTELPGGKLELNENLIQGAARELFEETGMHPTQPLQLFGMYDIASEQATWRTFVFFTRVQGTDVRLNRDEHSGYFWEKITDEEMLLRTELHSPGEMIVTRNLQNYFNRVSTS